MGSAWAGGDRRDHLSLTFSEQLNSRCWIFVASWMLICFNLRICRSDRVFTEMMMPRREGGSGGSTAAVLNMCGGGGEGGRGSGCVGTKVPVDGKDNPGKSVCPFTVCPAA